MGRLPGEIPITCGPISHRFLGATARIQVPFLGRLQLSPPVFFSTREVHGRSAGSCQNAPNRSGGRRCQRPGDFAHTSCLGRHKPACGPWAPDAHSSPTAHALHWEAGCSAHFMYLHSLFAPLQYTLAVPLPPVAATRLQTVRSLPHLHGYVVLVRLGAEILAVGSFCSEHIGTADQTVAT